MITGNRWKPKPGANTQRLSTLTTVKTSRPVVTAVKRDDKPSTPSLFVLNAAAITKPHAVEQLAADLTSYKSDIAVITETHCKTKQKE